jgi:hypothetical protein
VRTLLRTREVTPPEAPAPPPAAAPSPPADAAATSGGPAPEQPAVATCRACGAGLAADQDWCLECGTAAPGRLGGRPGWRLGAVVLALTLLLVGGASVAGYAAVTGDAERQTAAQNPAPGTPVPAEVPAPPAPESPTSEPPEPEPLPSSSSSETSSDFDTPAPPVDDTTIDPVTPLPTAPPTTIPGPDLSGGTAALSAFKIADDDLEVYDEYERVGAEFGDPEDALNREEPFFDVTVPADGEPIGAGLKVDLGAVREVREIAFRTTTPGMGLEVYGVAKGDPKGLQAGWRLLETLDLERSERDVTITLDGSGKAQRVRRLVLFFTRPANAEDPRASIGRLKVLG